MKFTYRTLLFFFFLTLKITSQEYKNTFDFYIENKKSLLGITIGQSIKTIPKERLQEFPFHIKDENRTIYYLISPNQERIALLYSDFNNNEKVGSIVIINNEVITEDGFKIGTIFNEIITQIDNDKLQIHIDKKDSSVILSVDHLHYTLDFFSDTTTISIEKIPLNSKVISILIQ